MFEAGKYYAVKMWEDGDEGGCVAEFGACQCIEVALPLVKLKDSECTGGGEIILNTASFAFVSAREIS